MRNGKNSRLKWFTFGKQNGINSTSPHLSSKENLISNLPRSIHLLSESSLPPPTFSPHQKKRNRKKYQPNPSTYIPRTYLNNHPQWHLEHPSSSSPSSPFWCRRMFNQPSLFQNRFLHLSSDLISLWRDQKSRRRRLRETSVKRILIPSRSTFSAHYGSINISVRLSTSSSSPETLFLYRDEHLFTSVSNRICCRLEWPELAWALQNIVLRPFELGYYL